MTVFLQIALISNQHNFMKMNENYLQLILVYVIWGLRVKNCLMCLWGKTIRASIAYDWCCVNNCVQKLKYQNSKIDNFFAKKAQVSGNKLLSVFF